MTGQGYILIAEDDAGIRQSLVTTLTALGFSVEQARNGEEALVKLKSIACEAVLLDINMPGIGGVETCQRMRRLYPRLPLIMLTVHDTEDDKVQALDAGADDYITKPFQVKELAARLRAAVRRFRQPTAADGPLVVRDITLDLTRHRVTKANREIRLTPKEFDMLHFLMERAGRPVPHAHILAKLWGPQFVDTREYLRVLVNQLRRKIEDDPTNPTYILTESSIGYCFREL